VEKTNKTQRIILSISLLVSNRKEQVRRTLESLEHLRNEIESELIVVDTVGEENSDGSLAIAKEYADKVIHFSWCNDFSAARNAGLSVASGEWFLYLDDDEWFEDTTELIQFFKSGEYKKYDRGWYVQRNYTSKNGTGYEDAYVDRMCCRMPDTRFCGKIHEYILPLGERIKKFSAYVHHYGYIFETQEEKERHSERNISLLEQTLKENPEDFRMAGQLVQEYVVMKRWEEAAKLCKSMVSGERADNLDMFAQYLLVMRFRIEIYQENWAMAEEIYLEYQEKGMLNKLPNFVCLIEMIQIKEHQEQYETVLRYVKSFFEQRKNLIEAKNYYTEQAVFDFLDYLSDKKERDVIDTGIHAIAKTGNCEMAKELLDRVDWLNEEELAYGPICWLVELYEKVRKEELFYPYAEMVMQNKKLKGKFAILLKNMLQKIQNERTSL